MRNGDDSLWTKAYAALLDEEWDGAREVLDVLNARYARDAVDAFIVTGAVPDPVRDRVRAWNDAVDVNWALRERPARENP